MGWLLVIATLLSLIIALYLGCRTISLFNLHTQGYFNTLPKKLFWLLLIVASLSLVISRLLFSMSDYWLPLIGNIVFSLVICFLYSLLIIDVFKLICWLLVKKMFKNSTVLQMSFVALGAIFFVVGLYMASSPRVIVYPIKINKPAPVNQLKIVQLSDIHINATTSRSYIENLVNNVNKLHPDYIFITGDTLDLRLAPYIDKNFAELFAQLQSTYGTFTILGNHEHYGIAQEDNNSQQRVIDAFKNSNMQVLVDTTFYDDRTGITLIGREDLAVYRLNQTRLDLRQLLDGVDQSKPILLLDHQPSNLDEAENLGVDIIYSGHTHAGQVFPMTLLVELMYKNSWGIYQSFTHDHLFTSIVTSGYGLWGPPIRLMTRAEIVLTEINFNINKLK